MKKQTKAWLIIIEAILFFGGMALWSLLKPDADQSVMERRKLTQRPAWDTASMLSGDYVKQLERYQLDQFPMRQTFRSIHAAAAKYALGKSDDNGYIFSEGHLSKLDYPLKPSSVQYASGRIQNVYKRYLQDTDTRVYLSVIPDKNYFLAAENGYPSMDYEALVSLVQKQNPQMTYLDIFPTMELSDFYRTDTHWRQERIADTAKALADGMNTAWTGEGYTQTLLTDAFYGVYAGQTALPVSAEPLYGMERDFFKDCRVYDWEHQKEIPVYDTEKATGRDGYEAFLGGSLPLITIENSQAQTERELVIFRDSFGSSLAPWLVESYAKITLVDLRLLSGDMLGRFITFDEQDVLFLYSTMLWNDSVTLK